MVNELILLIFFLFLSTPYARAELMDFSRAYLFVKLIYSLGIYLSCLRQTGERARQCAKPRPCGDQDPEWLTASQERQGRNETVNGMCAERCVHRCVNANAGA